MSRAKPGDTVKVHYVGRLDNDLIFEQSYREEPLEVTLGRQRVIPGLEQALLGMQPGDTKQVVVPPDKAFGQWRSELIFDFDREKVPPEIDLYVGKKLRLPAARGRPLAGEVLEVAEEVVTIDANHPLAGKQLTFDIQLLEIVAEA